MGDLPGWLASCRVRIPVPDCPKGGLYRPLNDELLPTKPMSYSHYDPDWTEPNAYDDRDSDRPEFEVDDELAYNIGWDGRDPADDEPCTAIVGSGVYE